MALAVGANLDELVSLSFRVLILTDSLSVLSVLQVINLKSLKVIL